MTFLHPRQEQLLQRTPFRCDKQTASDLHCRPSHLVGTALTLARYGLVTSMPDRSEFGRGCKLWNLTDFGREVLAMQEKLRTQRAQRQTGGNA